MAFPHMGGRQGSLPVTLCINHESRQETLRHYVVFPGIHKSDSDRSMCLNPRIDSVHVTLDRLIWANYIIPTYGQWLKELSTRLPDLLGSIKTLEIHDHDCVKQKDTSDVLYYIKHEMQMLSFFTGLKDVGFWPDKFYHDRGEPEWRYVSERTFTSWNDVAESVAELRVLFQSLRTEDPNCADRIVILRQTVLDKCPIEGCCH